MSTECEFYIYDKTSLGKGGMIGTVYCNFIIQN